MRLEINFKLAFKGKEEFARANSRARTKLKVHRKRLTSVVEKES